MNQSFAEASGFGDEPVGLLELGSNSLKSYVVEPPADAGLRQRAIQASTRRIIDYPKNKEKEQICAKSFQNFASNVAFFSSFQNLTVFC